jgi:uncharacterized protein YbjT (DUF2867 family)
MDRDDAASLGGAMMRRILVTGATGFTGERLVRRLVDKGYSVLALTRDPESPIAKALDSWGANLRVGDCSRRWTLWENIEGCDALVCCSHTRYAEACVQACRAVGVSRLITMSSTRRFTHFPDKTSQEVIEGEAAVAVSGLDWTIVRCSMIFGGARDRNVSRLAEWFRRRRAFPVFGRGTNLVQPVYVEDVVDALVTTIETEESVGHAINIAGPEPINFRKFLTEISRGAAGRDPLFIGVPFGMAILGATMFEPFLRKHEITPDMIHRLHEDKHCSIHVAREMFGFRPMPFVQALKLKMEGKAEVDAIYRREKSVE